MGILEDYPYHRHPTWGILGVYETKSGWAISSGRVKIPGGIDSYENAVRIREVVISGLRRREWDFKMAERPELPEGSSHVPLFNRHGIIVGWSICSAVDLAAVEKYRWCMSKSGRGAYNTYAITWNKGGGKWLKLHQVVAGESPFGKEVDHINGIRMDNRRSNLRFVTRSQNILNSRRLKSNNSTGISNVYHQPGVCKGLPWHVRFGVDGKGVGVGRYATKEEAALAAESFRAKLRESLPKAIG